MAKKKAVPYCASSIYQAYENFYSIGFGGASALLVRGNEAKACSACRVFCRGHCAVRPLCGLRCCWGLPPRVACGAPRRKRGPVPDWVWKRAMARAVTEDALRDAYAEQFCNVKSADAARVRTPAPCQIKCRCANQRPASRRRPGAVFCRKEKAAGLAGRGHLQKTICLWQAERAAESGCQAKSLHKGSGCPFAGCGAVRVKHNQIPRAAPLHSCAAAPPGGSGLRPGRRRR